MDDDPNVDENFKVVVRVRPPLKRELESGFLDVVKVDNVEGGTMGKTITLYEHWTTDDGTINGFINQHPFTFDTVYDKETTQEQLYEHTARPAVMSVLQGYNATMIAYGQTGTGKTYTMEGFVADEQERGIIPRATEEIFNYINRSPPNCRWNVRASYLQIYNEKLSDLIKPNEKPLSIHESPTGERVRVDNLSQWIVHAPHEICQMMEVGGKHRAVGQTRMSEMSSRSHAIVTLYVECHTLADGYDPEEVNTTKNDSLVSVKMGKLNIVDLAGSEKVRQTQATGLRLEESKKINFSLSCLGNVIQALTDSRQHIPYRDSKLTRILEDSIGGNCKTTMIAMISPANESHTESMSTLKFASRAKSIKNDAKINEDMDHKASIKMYEKELKKLRSALLDAHKNMAESRKTWETERKLRNSETERMLEKQLLPTGPVEEHPLFQQAIQKYASEFTAKQQELGKEKASVEEEKAHVDRYKQLLLKQRDIMIALTARLNERDETILSLQEELDAYDGTMSTLLAEKLRWQKIAEEGEGGGAHNETKMQKRGSSPPRTPLNDLSNGQQQYMRQQYDHEMARQKSVIEQLEAQLEATKRQHSEELSHVKDENDHLQKERRAFKRIMEKVQAKVDIIDKSTREQKLNQSAVLMNSNNPAINVVKESNQQVEETTKSLQQLLACAIQAVTDIPSARMAYTTHPQQ